MSNKKMKGVAFDSSSHDDIIRARFKHQTLVQDYLQLQKETEAARNRLDAMKQKKRTLEAEVRFLRRRHKFLRKTKPSIPQQVKSHNVETIQYRKSKEKGNPTKMATFPNLPLIPNQVQRGNTHTKMKNIIPSQPLPVFHLDRNVNSHGNNSSPVIDINQKSTVVKAKAPIFDLNLISVEEEELQESFDDQRIEIEQQNDLKLSICRNVVDGSTNRSGKRKISWQDPVALRV
ncbi:uncharacterized protein LOC143567306 [Bidens hawaiensis]|uniref:uncharacterized protein LOC143567306 n=1 Tax=Bidens hawaiensis TaxID=980011 RepID=UPI004049022E